jgi:tetratricopeptide (TPR) repeat protein
MSSDVVSDARLKYRDEFRSAHGEAFQHWFERLAVALHGDDCFLAIRVTRGDGGLDGLVLREGRVYQLYAPPTPATDTGMAAKARTDFAKARSTLAASLKAWTFVHNSADGKVGHLTAKAVSLLRDQNPDIEVEVLGIDGLWERVAKLPPAQLTSLFNVAYTINPAETEIRALLKRAGDLDNDDERKEAFDAAAKALAIAETTGLSEFQVKALIALCLMSGKRSSLGDRRHYFRKLQPLMNGISDPELRVMFHRAQASLLLDNDKIEDAEQAYLAAIKIATAQDASAATDDQLCAVRLEYVHLLCNAKRIDEAKQHIELAEAYARANPDLYDGALLREALNAGLHWASAVRDERACKSRIEELEASAGAGGNVLAVAGELINVANHLSHSKCNDAALAAAEAALRLSDRIPVDKRTAFQPGILYTIAMILYYTGRLHEALEKAQVIVNISETEKTSPIRFAATQLVSVISRELGDIPVAVEKAEIAVGLANDFDSSLMAKMNYAESLADQGETEHAFKEAQDAFHLVDGRPNLPERIRLEAAGLVGMLAAQLGREDIVKLMSNRLNEIPDIDVKLVGIRDNYRNKTKAYTFFRKQLIDISLFGETGEKKNEGLNRAKDFRRFVRTEGEEEPSEEPINSLRQANALTIGPLMKWWEDTYDDPNAVALDYDYWGRGCFAQILRNLQVFPHSLNVTVEVRTLEDVRQAIRLWALYSDFLLLLWKGPTKSGMFTHFIDGEWFGPWGGGYMIAAGTTLKSQSGRIRVSALGYASWLPDDIARFLTTEAKPFLAAGRLLLVPGSGVGCISPGYGVIEQLLAEVANCVPAIQQRRDDDQPLGPLPYSLDVPLPVLFDFVQEHEADLVQMRRLLLDKTAHIRRNGLLPSPKALELEIADTLRLLRSENSLLTKKRQLSATEQDTRMALAPFYTTGERLLSSPDRAFSPLLALESMGYGWKIGTAQRTSRYQFQPAKDEPIGAWLSPPEPGARFLAIRKTEEEQATDGGDEAIKDASETS